LALLAAFSRDPRQAVHSVPLLSHAESEELARRGSGERVTYPVTTVHQLFEDRVRSCPGRVAVVAGGVAVSYGELNGSANLVARMMARTMARMVTPAVGCRGGTCPGRISVWWPGRGIWRT